MTDAAGRVAVVTGAGRGIGRAAALALARGGAMVAALARTKADLDALEREDGSIRGFVCDVCDRDEVEKVFGTTEEELGPISVLVAAAGCAWFGPTLDMPPEQWDAQIGANLTGLYNTNVAAIRRMLPRGSGDIVNVLSVSAQAASAGSAAYTASKFGALGLSRSLNAEFRAKGIRVLSILPGATSTSLWDTAGLELDPSRMMSAEDVAEAILWMISRPRSAAADELLLMPKDGFL